VEWRLGCKGLGRDVGMVRWGRGWWGSVVEGIAVGCGVVFVEGMSVIFLFFLLC
jgi:hypothetical protein